MLLYISTLGLLIKTSHCVCLDFSACRHVLAHIGKIKATAVEMNLLDFLHLAPLVAAGGIIDGSSAKAVKAMGVEDMIQVPSVPGWVRIIQNKVGKEDEK